MMRQEEDFDIATLATYLHITPQQVERLVSRGKVPGRKVGGEWKFSRAEIHHWMEERIGLLEDDELQRVEASLREIHHDTSLPLTSMLSVDAIAIPLAGKTKRSVIEEMVQLAAQTGVLWDVERMIDAVQTREQLQSTAMPNGVALLHPRRPLANILGEPVLALGISSQGIPFGGSSQLTTIFFLICSTDDRGHLHTLARLSRMMQDSTWLSQLLQAGSPNDAWELFREAESHLE